MLVLGKNSEPVQSKCPRIKEWPNSYLNGYGCWHTSGTVSHLGLLGPLTPLAFVTFQTSTILSPQKNI